MQIYELKLHSWTKVIANIFSKCHLKWKYIDFYRSFQYLFLKYPFFSFGNYNSFVVVDYRLVDCTSVYLN